MTLPSRSSNSLKPAIEGGKGRRSEPGGKEALWTGGTGGAEAGLCLEMLVMGDTEG